MPEQGAHSAPGLCPGRLQGQTRQTQPQAGAPILPQPQDISSESRRAGSCSAPWSHPGPVQRVFLKMCPPSSALGTNRAVLLPCATRAMERHWKWQLGMQRVCVDTNTSIQTEMEWGKGSCPHFVQGGGAEDGLAMLHTADRKMDPCPTFPLNPSFLHSDQEKQRQNKGFDNLASQRS